MFTEPTNAMSRRHSHYTRNRPPSGEETEEELEYQSAFEDDTEGDSEVTLDTTIVKQDNSMVMSMAKLMRQMQEKQDKREQMHEQQMKTMLETIERLQSSNHETAKHMEITRAKKVDCPKLGPSQDTRMEDFRAWHESFLGFANLTKLNAECDLTGRRAIIRNAIDPTWQKLWSSGMLNIDETDDIESIMEKIKIYVRSKRNPLLDRQDFFLRNQKLGESVDDYLAELKLLYESCDFPDVTRVCQHCGELNDAEGATNLKTERLRDRLIFGLHDDEIQRKVLEEPLHSLTLQKTFQMVQAAEAAKNTSQDLRNEANISYVRRKSTYKRKQGYDASKKEIGNNCSKCGWNHARDSCLAEKSRCNNCNGMGHWEKCCPFQKRGDFKKLNSIYVRHVSARKCQSPIMELQTSVDGQWEKLQWLLDSGAQACVMSPSQAKSFGRIKPKYSKTKLLMADQGKLR